jgi:hypothetical protein
MRGSGQRDNKEDDDMGGNQSYVFGKQARIYSYTSLEYSMEISNGSH